MLSKKQKKVLERAKHLQGKFAEALIGSKGKDFKDQVITKGYRLIDSSDELMVIIDHLVEKVKEANALAGTAVAQMQTKGRKLKALEQKASHRPSTENF